jgi:hypothetical protein
VSENAFVKERSEKKEGIKTAEERLTVDNVRGQEIRTLIREGGDEDAA